MPRRRRVVVEGGLYHVYNRFARGEEIFADENEATRLVERIRVLKRRDGFVVYAWCLISNHQRGRWPQPKEAPQRAGQRPRSG